MYSKDTYPKNPLVQKHSLWYNQYQTTNLVYNRWHRFWNPSQDSYSKLFSSKIYSF